MKTFNKINSIILILLLTVFTACSKKGDNPAPDYNKLIVGKWTATESIGIFVPDGSTEELKVQDIDTKGETMLFKENKEYVNANGLGGQYEIDGKNLLLHYAERTKDQTLIIHQLDEHTLILRGNMGQDTYEDKHGTYYIQVKLLK